MARLWEAYQRTVANRLRKTKILEAQQKQRENKFLKNSLKLDHTNNYLKCKWIKQLKAKIYRLDKEARHDYSLST